MLVLLMAGCRKTTGITDEEMYSALDALISSPSSAEDSGLLETTIEFYAQAISDVMTGLEGDMEGSSYQFFIISRAAGSFLVDVSDIAETVGPEEYVVIQGSVQGSVYWDTDEGTIEVLDVHADKMTVYTLPSDQPDTSNVVEVSTLDRQGKFEFQGAHFTFDMETNTQLIAVYFNYTNESDLPTPPPLEKLYAYHGDVLVDIAGATGETSSYSLSNIDPNAVYARENQADAPAKGETRYCYVLYNSNPDYTPGDSFFLSLYADNFALTNDITMFVAESWEEVAGIA